MNSNILAADIGGSHISSTVVNTLDWRIDAKNICQTKTDSFGAKQSIIESWANNLQQSIRRGNIININQIAIALPGPFDYEKGIFQAHPEGKMGSLVGDNLSDLLQPYFQEKLTIGFENDAACFGLGAACFGAGKAFRRCIGITLGTGIGSSFIADGQIKKKGMGVPTGGEIYALPFKEGIADDYFSTRWFIHQAEEDISLKVSGVRELLATAPSYYIENLFQIFSHQFYQFLLPFAQDFEVDGIVLGGNIAKAWPHFSKYLIALFAQHRIKIVPSTLNERAIILGAAKVFTDDKETNT